jgi:hypothetical protein
MKFGFPPSGPRRGPVFNFKSERRHFDKSNRCLIPASAFFEFTIHLFTADGRRRHLSCRQHKHHVVLWPKPSRRLRPCCVCIPGDGKKSISPSVMLKPMPKSSRSVHGISDVSFDAVTVRPDLVDPRNQFGDSVSPRRARSQGTHGVSGANCIARCWDHFDQGTNQGFREDAGNAVRHERT